MLIEKQRIAPCLVVLLLLWALVARAGEEQVAQNNPAEDKARVQFKVTADIKARPKLVWSAIHDARTEYPGLQFAKVISENERGSVFEQKFVVPFMGEADCTFSFVDSPPDRIDYKLLKSNIFTAIHGSWILTSRSDSRSTSVEHSCSVAVKGIMPKFLLKLTLGRKLGKQLDFVKTRAEKKELEMQMTEKKL